jgi:gliding motility-associated-like protein
LFRVKTADAPKSFDMILFNRYGGKVFESKDANAGWNGTIGRNPAMPGVYVYVVMITTSAGGVVEKKGTVVLIR